MPLAKNDISPSERNYVKIAETLAAIVKEISDLSVPEETVQHWKTLSSAMFVVDDRLDSIAEVEARKQFTRSITDSLKGNVPEFSEDKDLGRAVLRLENLASSLQGSQKEFFSNLLSRILKVTEKMKVEENPRKLVDLRRIEGQIAVQIFLPFLPEEFRVSKKYQQLVHALTRLGRASNAFDSFIDLPADYRTGQVKVQPTIPNRLLFLGAVLSDGLSVVKTTGISVDLVKRALRAAKAVVVDK
jgi:hypothetical protein